VLSMATRLSPLPTPHGVAAVIVNDFPWCRQRCLSAGWAVGFATALPAGRVWAWGGLSRSWPCLLRASQSSIRVFTYNGARLVDIGTCRKCGSGHSQRDLNLDFEGRTKGEPDRLESLAKERGLTIFARINFSADARRAGRALRPTELLILGSCRSRCSRGRTRMVGSGCRTTHRCTFSSDTVLRRSCSEHCPTGCAGRGGGRTRLLTLQPR